MSEEGEGSFKRFGYPAICVVAFILAGYFTYQSLTGTPINEMPNTAESKSAYSCKSCGYTCMMTPREEVELIQSKGQEVTRGDSESGMRTSALHKSLPCPTCGQFALVTATQCSEHNIIFIGECPVCAKMKPPEEESAPLSDEERGRRSRG